MSDDTELGGEALIHGLKRGLVVDNKDPDKLHRVRVKIPGLIDKSEWAWPMGGLGGGANHRGAASSPAEGAVVAVMFLDGLPDAPFYLAGPWGAPGGKSEVPGPVGGYRSTTATDHAPRDPEDPKGLSPEDAAQVTALETKRFVMWLDDRPGKERLVVRDKVNEDEIELDAAQGGIAIRASGLLLLHAEGTVAIRGASVIINGRVVLPSADPF